MTDYKQLCVELLAALENEGYAHWIRHTPDEDELCLRARAALAESKPERPTREEAVAVYSEVLAIHECQTLGDMAEHFARAVLARWGK